MTEILESKLQALRERYGNGTCPEAAGLSNDDTNHCLKINHWYECTYVDLKGRRCLAIIDRSIPKENPPDPNAISTDWCPKGIIAR